MLLKPVCCQTEGGGKHRDEGLCPSRFQHHQKRLLQGEKTHLDCGCTAACPGPSLSVHQPKEEMVFSGKYKTGEQILRLANERFAVPEMLFHPSDIGIQEMGIPEAIVDSIQSLPEGLTFFPTSPLCCRIALVFNSYKYRDFDSQAQKRAETLCFSIRKSVFK